jgi:hypothetical protein
LFAARKERLPGSIGAIVARAGQVALEVYLREAQAYMLISMPTDTSTIFGVFQLIHFSPGSSNQDLSHPGSNLERHWTQRKASQIARQLRAAHRLIRSTRRTRRDAQPALAEMDKIFLAVVVSGILVLIAAARERRPRPRP